MLAASAIEESKRRLHVRSCVHKVLIEDLEELYFPEVKFHVSVSSSPNESHFETSLPSGQLEGDRDDARWSLRWAEKPLASTKSAGACRCASAKVRLEQDLKLSQRKANPYSRGRVSGLTSRGKGRGNAIKENTSGGIFLWILPVLDDQHDLRLGGVARSSRSLCLPSQ
jgi:hypothetical protein